MSEPDYLDGCLGIAIVLGIPLLALVILHFIVKLW